MEHKQEYKTWYNMRHRCYNPNCQDYKNYGGRGITVCDRWLNSFQNFLNDMGLKPFQGAHIDRIDNNDNYKPSNCQWVTLTENNRNTRRTKLSMGKAREIRKGYKRGDSKKLALKYGVGVGCIQLIIYNKRWIE